ncbi:MAG TPA: metal-dependent hydrolase [Nevskiaceae bacterium]|nr:metal-dependent hydrolase [Nevskiaceae bacterium]
MATRTRPTITPRVDLDFRLDEDIPRYWLGGDIFKTRFFDAMSTLFPEGERFFIACVRDYKDRVTDPELKRQVAQFTMQEGQHGRVHTRFNARLQAQGIAVDRIVAKEHEILFDRFRGHFPRVYTLAETAAAEHMTATMAHGFFRHGLLELADPRIRAVYAWHAVEEIEHKAVAFDVFQKVAHGGYFVRVLAWLQESILFPLHVFLIMRYMFTVDGIHGRARAALWLRGLWWLYGPGGLYMRVMPHYLSYLLPGFHPWKGGQMNSYRRWTEIFERTGDPLKAGDVLAAP